MKNDVEKFNLVWGPKMDRDLTSEEYEKIIKQHPLLWNSYFLQESIAKSYKKS